MGRDVTEEEEEEGKVKLYFADRYHRIQET